MSALPILVMYNIVCSIEYAGVMELADVLDSKSSGSDTVSVRPRSPAPKKQRGNSLSVFLVPTHGLVELISTLCVERVQTPISAKGSMPCAEI